MAEDDHSPEQAQRGISSGLPTGSYSPAEASAVHGSCRQTPLGETEFTQLLLRAEEAEDISKLRNMCVR